MAKQTICDRCGNVIPKTEHNETVEVKLIRITQYVDKSSGSIQAGSITPFHQEICRICGKEAEQLLKEFMRKK